MSDEQVLEFWRNMALGLKDELVIRGDRIDELEAQLISVSRELTSTSSADRYYRGFNDGFAVAESRIAELEAQLAEARKNLAFADNLYAGAVDAIAELEAQLAEAQGKAQP